MKDCSLYNLQRRTSEIILNFCQLNCTKFDIDIIKYLFLCVNSCKIIWFTSRDVKVILQNLSFFYKNLSELLSSKMCFIVTTFSWKVPWWNESLVYFPWNIHNALASDWKTSCKNFLNYIQRFLSIWVSNSFNMT